MTAAKSPWRAVTPAGMPSVAPAKLSTYSWTASTIPTASSVHGSPCCVVVGPGEGGEPGAQAERDSASTVTVVAIPVRMD